MAAINPNPNENEGKDLSAITVDIQGRIDSTSPIKKADGTVSFYQTTVIVPAKDAYSHPTTFAVNAEGPLGSVGSDVKVKCRLSSYSRKNSDGTRWYNMKLWKDN